MRDGAVRIPRLRRGIKRGHPRVVEALALEGELAVVVREERRDARDDAEQDLEERAQRDRGLAVQQRERRRQAEADDLHRRGEAEFRHQHREEQGERAEQHDERDGLVDAHAPGVASARRAVIGKLAVDPDVAQDVVRDRPFRDGADQQRGERRLYPGRLLPLRPGEKRADVFRAAGREQVELHPQRLREHPPAQIPSVRAAAPDVEEHGDVDAEQGAVEDQKQVGIELIVEQEKKDQQHAEEREGAHRAHVLLPALPRERGSSPVQCVHPPQRRGRTLQVFRRDQRGSGVRAAARAGRAVEAVRRLQHPPQAARLLLQQLGCKRAVIRRALARCRNMDHRALVRALQARLRALPAAVQREADRLRRAASARFSGRAVPKREQDMAVRGDVDARLAIAEMPVLRRRLRLGRADDEHLRRGREQRIQPRELRRGEGLPVGLRRHRKRADQRDAERERLLRAERVRPGGDGAEHDELGVRRHALQLFQFLRDQLPQARNVLRPQPPVAGDTDDDRDPGALLPLPEVIPFHDDPSLSGCGRS